jgi:hypothetical protein
MTRSPPPSTSLPGCTGCTSDRPARRRPRPRRSCPARRRGRAPVAVAVVLHERLAVLVAGAVDVLAGLRVRPARCAGSACRRSDPSARRARRCPAQRSQPTAFASSFGSLSSRQSCCSSDSPSFAASRSSESPVRGRHDVERRPLLRELRDRRAIDGEHEVRDRALAPLRGTFCSGSSGAPPCSTRASACRGGRGWRGSRACRGRVVIALHGPALVHVRRLVLVAGVLARQDRHAVFFFFRGWTGAVTGGSARGERRRPSAARRRRPA